MNPKKSRYYTYIRPIIRSKFAKTYTSLIFSLVTIAIFAFYAIRPTVTTILSLQKSIDEQNQVLNTLKEKVDNLVNGKRNYENIPEPIKNKLNNLVPDNPALPQLINSLAFAAEDAEASISGIQIQPIHIDKINPTLNADAELKEIEFTFITEGEFSELMKVLTTLRRMDRLIEISVVNFIQPPETALTLSITGKAYFLKN